MMILEKYIDYGILLERILNASKVTKIAFNNGKIIVGDDRYIGSIEYNYTYGYTIDTLEMALQAAYEKVP